MSFTDVIKACFAKYADFNGRAKRAEYWWFALFCFVVAVLLDYVSSPVSWIFSLATLLPSLSVGSRRLHDMNKKWLVSSDMDYSNIRLNIPHLPIGATWRRRR